MEKKEQANFMQVGQTLKCGHCHFLEFGEGLKQAERAIPNYKCDCKCHTPTEKSIRELKLEISTLKRFVATIFRGDRIPSVQDEYVIPATDLQKVLDKYG